MRYRHDAKPAFALRIKTYFSPETLDCEARSKSYEDQEEREVNRLQREYNLVAIPGHGYNSEKAQQLHGELQIAQMKASVSRTSRIKDHWNQLLPDRLEVLQCLLSLLAQDGRHEALDSFQRDIRRFMADSGVQLNIKGNPPLILPLEEPLLQKEVLDKVLPRLEATFPERARDLGSAYHDLLKGVDTNTVFGNAFKALEELARNLTGDGSLKLSDRAALEKHFPKLHGTIRASILKLAGHRGDEGAHGRKGPDEWEIRYLLLSICNVALLLLEYKDHCG
ncbi:MAG: hypothetical protein AB1555_15160 [Nitrospirota bacterium]